MIYNVARVSISFTKFQVDTCKTKKRYICACAVGHPPVEIQDILIMWQESGSYLQNFKLIHAKVKKINLRMCSCPPCS